MAAARPRRGARLVVSVGVVLATGTAGCGDGSVDRRDRLGTVVDNFVADTGGGIAVAVVEDGTIAAITGGRASLDGERTVDGATSFRIASVTKTFLAALTLMLVDDDRLGVDDALRDLFDAPGAWGEVTARQLLNHTSGLPRSGPRIDPSTWRTPADIDLDPLCAPGACRNYADENYVVVGLVIEHVTGSPLEGALRERILEPLELERTFLEPAETPTPPVAEHPARELWKPLPGVVTNAEDLARFGAALFGGELLSDASARAMLDFDATADLPCAEECHMPPGYGLGVIWYADLLPCDTWGHDGSTGAFLGYLPATGTTVAVVTNVEPWPDDFGRSIVEAATGAGCA
jgi:D-alanyl-D-alanine carboxypeptidase